LLGNIDGPKRKTAIDALKVIRDFQKTSIVYNNIVTTNVENQEIRNDAISILNNLEDELNKK
jgi:hypothetical protein